ncbi:MAG: transposase [candidate division WOR-3 bacterium]|nr:transposase [candidate division WOR-3 bacterium]
MARSLRIQYPGAYYHVMCRGNASRKIFMDDLDRKKFLDYLTESVEVYHVVLFAYVLMQNHFHMLLKTEKANLAEFMRRFNICYTGWFNYHHGCCGHLFQGRYKSILIDADSYLLEVSRYIHLNVVRGSRLGIADSGGKWRYVRRYQWSTLPGYLDKNSIVDFVSYDEILTMIGGRSSYRDFMLDGLRRGIRNPFDLVKYRTILGDDDFITRIKAEHLENGSTREQPAFRGLVVRKIDAEVILQHLADIIKIDRTILSKRRGPGVVRGIAAELLYRYGDLNLDKIGALLGGIDYCSVSQLRRRLKQKMVEDKQTMILFGRINRVIAGLCHM